MSLINKMLKDLEARQSDRQRPDPQSIYQGLRATRSVPAPRRILTASAGVVSLVLVGTVAWFVWLKTGGVPAEGPVPATAPAIPALVEVTPPVAAPAARVRKPVTGATSRPKITGSPKPDSAAAAIELNSRPLTSDDLAENKYREGVQLIRQSRMDDAEPRLRAALALSPAHVHARESLAALLVEQGRWLEATALLEEGLKVLPNQVSFGFLLARLYVEQGKDAAGLQLLERLQRHAASNPDFLAFMATLYQRTGQHAEAVKFYQQATQARPAEGRWWVGLGISLEAVSEREKARAAFQRANSLPLDSRLAEFVADRLKQLPDR